MKQRSYLFIVLMLLSMDCAKKVSRFPAAEPVAVADSARRDWVEELIKIGERRFEWGLNALERGDRETALEYFDLAVEAAVSCLPSQREIRLQVYFEELIQRIHEAEVAFVKGGETVISPTTRVALEGLLEDAKIDLELGGEEVIDRVDEGFGLEFPIVKNKVVDQFVKVFTNEKAHIIGAGLERSTRYLPMIRSVFRQEGLPLELSYLPLIESAYKVEARSRAAATGLWQFVSGTARLYGLKVGWWLDERHDPLLSTRAAARYLKDLYQQFGDWQLALSAYNAGPGRLRRAIARGKTRDFWQLYRRKLIPRETRGYIPAFMAGLVIASDPVSHGFGGLNYWEPLPFEVAQVDFGVALKEIAAAADLDPVLLEELNPFLTRGSTVVNGKTRLHVPPGSRQRVELALAGIPDAKKIRSHRYRIRRGDTLGRLAAKFGTSVAVLKQANRIRNPRRLRIGQVLTIPLSGTSRASSRPEPRLEMTSRTYTVKGGDSLYGLSKRFQTTIPSIVELNPSIKRGMLQPGQKLTISQGDRWRALSKTPSRGRGYTLYLVRSGDTVSRIGFRFNVTTRHLLAFNGLDARSIIKVGQKLKIPNRSSGNSRVLMHKVSRGETLSSIARLHRTSVGKLMEWNRLPSQHRIHIDQTLVIYR